MSDKEMVIERVRDLPDGLSVEQIAQEIDMLAAIQRGERAADEGRVRSHEEVKELLAEWTAK